MIAQPAHYHAIALQLRGGELFDGFVHNLTLRLAYTPEAEHEAEIVDDTNLVKAIIEVLAEERGLPLNEGHLSDIAGAVVADALDLLARMPAGGGHA